jgi:uncharacterized membrane protein
MKLAIASLSLMLAACSAPQAPATPEAPAAPAAPEPPAAPASAPMAKRAPGQDNTSPLQVFRAFGTEPFWNVNVEDTTLTFTTPEDPEGTVMQGARQPSADGVEIPVPIPGSRSCCAWPAANAATACPTTATR